VLLVHGISSNSQCLDFGLERWSLAAHLARAGFDCFALDLRGHGRSRPARGGVARDWSFDDYLRKDVPAALDAVRAATGQTPKGFIDRRVVLEAQRLLAHTELPIGRVGVMICYDLEFPEFTRAVALAGADLLAIPTNWPWTDRPEGEHAPEVVIAQGTARINHLAIACCDRSGVERGTRWNEGTALIDPDGWLVAEAGPGADAEAAADLDLARSRDKSYNPRNDVLADRRTDLYPSGR
jgi:pimeloyl-ACP methyl ester carboxylesterase